MWRKPERGRGRREREREGGKKGEKDRGKKGIKRERKEKRKRGGFCSGGLKAGTEGGKDKRGKVRQGSTIKERGNTEEK